MVRYILAMIVLCLLAPAPDVAGNPLSAGLDPAIWRELTLDGEVSRTLWEGDAPTLIPDLPIGAGIKADVDALGSRVGVEVLYLYTSGHRDLDSRENLLRVYNILRSVSTMEGILYYSASREKMRTLFEKSYLIDSPSSRRPLPDPEFSAIPARDSSYNLQKDLTFGENIYRTEYFAGSGYLASKTRNLTTMRYLLLPVIKPEKSLSYFILVPYRDQVLFYGLTVARTMSFFGIEKSREASFYNRIKAMIAWFGDALDG
jgi:hypothetical protein